MNHGGRPNLTGRIVPSSSRKRLHCRYQGIVSCHDKEEGLEEGGEGVPIGRWAWDVRVEMFLLS